jgi:streptogramin lyase
VVSASPVNSGAIGVSPPVTVAEVRAAGGVYRLPLPFPSVAATPYGVYVSWDVTSYGRATSDVLARIDPPSGTITASVLTDGFGQAVAADGSLWVTTGSEVLRLKPATNPLLSRVPIPAACRGTGLRRRP